MGLSHAPEYTWSEHFEKRAHERFGVEKDQLRKWLNKQFSSLRPYPNFPHSQPETEAYVSDEEVIFVCKPKTKAFVTCYPAKDMITTEGQKKTIHENNVELYQKEEEKTRHRYLFKDCKEMLEGIQEDLEEFYRLCDKVRTAKVSASNYKLIESVLDQFHVIKNAMRIIEGRQGDFKPLQKKDESEAPSSK